MDFAPLPQHLATITLHDTGDNFHERGFASAIFAEQQVDFAGLDGQVSVTQRCDAAVPFFDVVEFEEHRKRTVYNGFGSLPVWWPRRGARLTRRKRNPNARPQ